MKQPILIMITKHQSNYQKDIHISLIREKMYVMLNMTNTTEGKELAASVKGGGI